MRRIGALGVVLAAALALQLAPAASAQVQPYGTNDAGGFHNILPPGTNGFDNLQQLLAWEASKQRPAHNDDQLGMYSNLTTAAPNITEAQIPQYFKDATFGVPAGDVASTQTPEPGVTIVRDKGFGVPHIYGDTRAELMFGIGYATAEDRLFFVDVLRHAGEGQLAAFAGGSNAAMDEQVWQSEPYTQQDLVNQVNYALASSPAGSQIYSDCANYIAGINAYITMAESNPINESMYLPGEYEALGDLQGPKQFSLEDLISVAALVGGIFGNGGGDQLHNAVLYENLKQKFGAEHRVVAGDPVVVHQRKQKHKSSHKHKSAHAARHKASAKSKKHAKTTQDRSGFATFESFVDPADPEAPTTARGHKFPYQTLPKPSKKVATRIALPDPGSVHFTNPIVAGALPSGGGGVTLPLSRRSKPAIADALGPLANAGPGLLAFPRGMSNALLISAKNSASGHPLAVMGPQVSYFTPQILMEEDIHGPGIDADGAAFDGVNMYVELGHGTDYAFSATSAGQNIIDTFADPLCNPTGGPVSISSDYYLLQGHCVQMQTLTDHESWTPNLADMTPAGSVTFSTQRTAFGIVTARATIHGRPVMYANLRSTYLHEADSIAGFYLFNNPAAMRTPQDFFNAASHIGYTFNWFFANNQHIAYFNSGANPVRAAHTDPLFPTWANYGWAGYHPAANLTPASLTEQQMPEMAHPHATDQSYLTSWNNKQAPGYNDAATGQEYASVYRSQLLDNNINAYLRASHHKMTLANLINAMGNAGTQDLRGVEVLPYALKIIGHPSNPTLAHVVSELSTWVASGAHRINRTHPGASGNYDQTDAVRIMDAWWPLLVKAEFGPVLGTSLLSQVESQFPINDEPGHGTSGSHLGSSWDVGFYGIVQKDLRAVLHKKVRGALDRIYCGKGSRKQCRAALDSSLMQAAAESPAQVYPADGVCAAGNQMCSDSIQFRAIGAISQPLIEWINRPTFQQAVEIIGHLS